VHVVIDRQGTSGTIAGLYSRVRNTRTQNLGFAFSKYEILHIIVYLVWFDNFAVDYVVLVLRSKVWVYENFIEDNYNVFAL